MLSTRKMWWLWGALLLGSSAATAKSMPPDTAAASPASTPNSAPTPPPGELARSKALIDAGQPAAARARLLPLVAAHPRWARATALLALTYFKENRFEVAAPLFARALATDPEEIAVLPPYGWTLQALGRHDEAKAIFERLVARLPDYPSGHAGLAQVALDQNDIAAARHHFEAAARLATAQGDPELAEQANKKLKSLPIVIPPTPLTRPTQPTSSFDFSVVPESAGIDLVMTSGANPSREILEVNGGGIALLDYDRDGDLDVFLANGATMANPEAGPGSRLYANRGDGQFDDVTAAVGISLHRWAMGVAVGDVDGDGWDDLYVTCYGANVLLRNEAGPDGSRHFRDISAAAGVADSRWSTSAA
ncbi:FG-GAP-like repeat-containing protein, partial [Dokdonella sp.]|uniref:FG-GAP-like repeat-containing protein n=1 Tax=Dokdonella sp. TaxID=2291710 RepID=UPI003C531901